MCDLVFTDRATKIVHEQKVRDANVVMVEMMRDCLLTCTIDWECVRSLMLRKHVGLQMVYFGTTMPSEIKADELQSHVSAAWKRAYYVCMTRRDVEIKDKAKGNRVPEDSHVLIQWVHLPDDPVAVQKLGILHSRDECTSCVFVSLVARINNSERDEVGCHLLLDF
jgi:hypothetical protein